MRQGLPDEIVVPKQRGEVHGVPAPAGEQQLGQGTRLRRGSAGQEVPGQGEMDRAIPVTADRIGIGSRVEQGLDDIAMEVLGGLMERSVAGLVAGPRQSRIALQLAPDPLQISGLGRLEDRGHPRGERKSPGEVTPQQRRDLGMAAILGERQQRFLEGIAAIGEIGSVRDQELDNREVAFAHREMDRRSVVVLHRGEAGRPRDQRLDPGRGHPPRAATNISYTSSVVTRVPSCSV